MLSGLRHRVDPEAVGTLNVCFTWGRSHVVARARLPPGNLASLPEDRREGQLRAAADDGSFPRLAAGCGQGPGDAPEPHPRDHLMILVTLPEPTVRPPSRMAKPRPISMAIGWISATVISVLSPGMTISVPSGSVMTPVTSVVRK